MLKRIRIWMICIMALALCMNAAALAEEDTYAVPLAEGAVLLDTEGNEIVPPGQYGVLYEIYGLPEGVSLYAGERASGEGAGFALINARGEAVTEFEYQSLEYADGRVVFSKNQRMGVMDIEGNILIEAEYTALAPCGDGGYLATKTDPYDDAADGVYRVEADGSAQSAGVKIASVLSVVSEGLSPAASADSGLYGYLNEKGEWAIQPVYEWADVFKDGRARAAASDGQGLIDAAGNWLITPQYEYIAYAGGDSLIAASEEGSVSLIHPETLKTVASYEGEGIYAYPAENLSAVVCTEESAVLVNEAGEEWTKPESCEAISQWAGMEDRVIVRAGGADSLNVYLYNMDGTQLAGPYRDIMPLGRMDGELHYAFTSYEAEKVEYEEYGLTFWDEVPGTRKCGVLSAGGEELCAFETEYISYLSEGRMLVQWEDSAAIADFSGNILREYKKSGAGEMTE